jgi:hypothetical protein
MAPQLDRVDRLGGLTEGGERRAEMLTLGDDQRKKRSTQLPGENHLEQEAETKLPDMVDRTRKPVVERETPLLSDSIHSPIRTCVASFCPRGGDASCGDETVDSPVDQGSADCEHSPDIGVTAEITCQRESVGG